MANYYEIRESRRGRKSEDESYECGYEDGYNAAMEEMESGEDNGRSMRRSRHSMSRRKSWED